MEQPRIAEGNKNNKKSSISAILGAAFIMATSAIGPGFLTQTAAFTQKFAASFAFVILISIVLDIGAQLNAWRIIGVSGMRGQDIANKVLPGMGYFVAFVIALGGLAFNIGNVGGAALSFNVLFNMDVKVAAIISGVIGVSIFLFKEVGPVMDRVAQVLGGMMILLVTYMAFKTSPPVGEAVVRSVYPENPELLVLPIITLLGGTVGGYITFAGGHRLIDAGIVGKENIKAISRGSVAGILIASLMRVLLFLAVLGVVAAKFGLDPDNPAASAFKYGAGMIGYKFFGLVLFAASITSIVGAAYTSVSFMKTLHPLIEKYEKRFIMGFIVVSTCIMAFIGKPVKLLILAGALNGLVLPLTIGIMILAARRKDIVGDYKHPLWMSIFGVVVVLVAAYAGYNALMTMTQLAH